MREISPTDNFEIRRESELTNLDYVYLSDLYLPLVGFKALGVYMALVSSTELEAHTHQELFLYSSLSSGEFSSSISALEAVGLVRSFSKKEAEIPYYVYCLYAPRDPKEFFSNILFAGTLRKNVTPEMFETLKNKYQVPSLPGGDYLEVSESFPNYFKPDFTDPAYSEATFAGLGHAIGKIRTGFDRNLFLKNLKENENPAFEKDSFSEEELVKIARVAALYGYEEETMASLVAESFYFKGKFAHRLDEKKLEGVAADSYHFVTSSRASDSSPSDVHGDGIMDKLIRKMDSSTPIEFLTYLQKGHKPAKSDIDLINELTLDMGLAPSVCNALVYYVLFKNDNILSARFTEKIGASLVRKGVRTSLDALNFLTEQNNKSPAKPPQISKISVPSAPQKPVEAKKDEGQETLAPADDPDFDEMMKYLYGEK